jgi:hypothetical protein
MPVWAEPILQEPLMQRTLLAVAVLSIAALGCSQSDTVAVTGTVTLNGAPAADAEVKFEPTKGGRMATGHTDAAGHFTVETAKPNDGAMPGEYVVTLGEYYPPGKAPALPKGGGPLPSRFPPKYGNPAESPLKATVERGAKNEFRFEVTGP